MPENSFTEITNQSWFSRLGGAIKGIIFGVIIFVVAFPLLFWNEGRAVKRYKALKEGAGVVVSVAEDKVDAANEAKLVHVSGLVTTDDVLKDSEFGISANAIKLSRKVQMYQWKESKKTKKSKKTGGGTTTKTTYSYQKVWSDKIIKSGDFKEPQGHTNPASMAYESKEYLAKNVTLGAFDLSGSLVGKIGHFEDVDIQGSAGKLPAGLEGKVKVHDNSYYVGKSPESPEVGDIKVGFGIVKPLKVSVISRQIGTTFEPYNSEVGGQIELLQVGTVSADSMFEAAKKENAILTWILRFAGFILLFVGLGLVFNPLSILADVIPFLGDIIGAGVWLVAFLLAMALSLLIISIAWFVCRPLLGILLLIFVGIIVFGVKLLPKKS